MKTYRDIAENDLLWAKSSMNIGDQMGQYNMVVVQAQQSAEKFMKGFINDFMNEGGKHDKDLVTHNLRKMALLINEFVGEKILNPIECKYLGDWYFDARYPGDNYTEVRDREEAEYSIQLAEKIRDALYEQINKINAQLINHDKGYNSQQNQIQFGREL
ncbi:MAG: HEPN domain-containing protein [Cellulosilyticum sp.]|nr:HEPN domain-containing protein [Cellulosilyticum sp.]